MAFNIKNVYVVMAREVSVDKNDGMTSIFKLIEKFTFGYKPAELLEKNVQVGINPILFPHKYDVATSWYLGEKLKKETTLKFAIAIVDSTGKKLEGPVQEHHIPVNIDRINIQFGMDGVPVLGAGKYEMIVTASSATNKELASGSYPFEVDLIEE